MNSCERVDEEEEVEERLEEAGEQDHPGPAVDHDVPLDDQQAADRRPRRSRQAGACDELASSDDEPPAVRHPRGERARPSTHASEVREVQRVARRDVSERQVAAERHAVPERREPGDHLERRRQRSRSGRTSPRRGTSGGSGSGRSRRTRPRSPCAPPRPRSAPRTRARRAPSTGIASTPSGESTAPNAVIDDEVDRRRQNEPEREVRLVAEHHVAHAQRRREHRVVLAIPLDRREHRPARLERRDLHRRRGHEPGRDELEVRDPVREVRPSGRRTRRARRRARAGRRPA